MGRPARNNVHSNLLPSEVKFRSGISMAGFRGRSLSLCSFPVVLFLCGCGGPEIACDSPETRNAVLNTVSNDHGNALANFAAKNSNVAKDVENSPNSENARPSYLLDDEKIVTVSASPDKRTLTCSGSISVTVGDTKASKEVHFTVQKPADGKLAVSVAPFQFR